MNTGIHLFNTKDFRRSILSGFLNTFRSFTLIRVNRLILVYFVIPFILNMTVLTGIFYFSYTSLVPAIHSLLSGSEWYIQFLNVLVSPVLFVLLSLFTVLLYSVTGGIITAPFLDMLSSVTEKILGTATEENGFSAGESIRDILRAAANSIRLIVLIIIINFILLILNIIPGGSFLFAFLNFLSVLFFYGFQFYDFPLERRRYSFNEKLKITWKFRRQVYGSGLSFFLISFIPVIGFLGLNLCTIGAAITFAEDINPVLTRTGKTAGE